jgi:hypothetical protein
MSVAGIVGYLGCFAFFGQDSPVSCPFRLWIISLALAVMLAALFAKTFRIFFLYKIQRQSTQGKVKDWQLCIVIILLVLPVFLILIIWTAFATPTADTRDLDGDVHYVCQAGGLIGTYWVGYIFFGILCFYFAIILLIGMVLSIFTRNVYVLFNESKLIDVSIYNFFFLSCVVIPVYFALESTGVVWQRVILLTAILYAFSATLFLQFIPKIWGVIITDKLKESELKKQFVSDSEGTNTATNTGADDDDNIFKLYICAEPNTQGFVIYVNPSRVYILT